MKSILNSIVLITGCVFLLTSCDKADKLSSYGNGTVPVLTASATSIAPAAADSNKVALTLSWSNPKYATDSAKYKYVIDIDSSGKNFSNPSSFTVTGAMSRGLLAKEINNVLLSKGYAFNVPVSIDVRVSSSYSNNNERLTSNTIKLQVTPYKIPPKVALPSSGKLFLVGDASDGGWNNPVPVPSQEFAQIDETIWGGIFHLTGGKQFLILPVNGDWTHKFAISNNGAATLNQTGDFGFDLGDNFPGPTATGFYKIVVDFQSGKYTVTPYSGTLPTNLYIVGDATTWGWNNPVPVATQQFTRLNSSVWQLTVPLIGGKQYLLLPVNGDWSHKYAVNDNSIAGLAAGGSFGYDLSSNFPAPAASGTYKITVNFLTGTFTVQ
ncbi:MAG: SusE domain-containing protein [Chitinophagaceae bacterium]|nr:SusE domain-containing protein [Chitinophagaceae bacterium]